MKALATSGVLLLVLVIASPMVPAPTGLWPLGSGYTAYRLRATYLQPEGPGTIQMHLGADVIAGRKRTKVYALEGGVVVDVVNDDSYVSGLVIDSKSRHLSFLYLHMEKGTVQFGKGDKVFADDWLGDVVSRDTVTGVTHLHVARIQWSDSPHAWNELSKLSIGNPMKAIDPAWLNDGVQPVVDAITATSSTGNFVFGSNEDPSSSGRTYWPKPIAGAKTDVIARVSDGDGRSPNALAPHELVLTISGPGGSEKFVLRLDGKPPRNEDYPELLDPRAIYNTTDAIASVGVGTGVPSADLCYYFVLTNGSASGSSPAQSHHWVPQPGTYVLDLEVQDVAGRSHKVSATVEVN